MDCPKCNSPIVYNGNYFCSNYPKDCDWRHDPKNKIEESRLYSLFKEGKIKRQS